MILGMHSFSKSCINPCPAESGFIFFDNTVEPDYLASGEAI